MNKRQKKKFLLRGFTKLVSSSWNSISDELIVFRDKNKWGNSVKTIYKNILKALKKHKNLLYIDSFEHYMLKRNGDEFTILISRGIDCMADNFTEDQHKFEPYFKGKITDNIIVVTEYKQAFKMSFDKIQDNAVYCGDDFIWTPRRRLRFSK